MEGVEMKAYRTVLLSCVMLMLGGIAAGQEELTTPVIVEKPEVKLLDQEGAGKLYQVGEHLVCVMEGAPAEMGYQHGRLLGTSIRRMIKEGYIVKALYERGYTDEYILTQSARMEKHFPPEYIEEMKGIVKGIRAAGIEDVRYEDIRTAATNAELSHHGPDAPPGCSNFAAWGKWTTDGRLLHGRNLDWSIDRGAQDGAAILVWRPRGGRPFMMVGWTGGIGSVSGMNAAGITFGEMTSSSSAETFDGLPLMAMMRRVLEKAATLEEALNVIRDLPPTTGWNFILGDGKIPDARAIERDAASTEVYAPKDANEGEQTGHWAMEDAVRRTNHPIGVDKLNKLIAVYSERQGIQIPDLQTAIPLLKQQNTWQRYDWLGKQIQARPAGMDVPQALQLLANGPVKAGSTLHSWVFDPKNKTAYVAIAGGNPAVPAWNRPYTRIDLSQWFE
jgi:hypothetical protein